jgi:hypothetical protein
VGTQGAQPSAPSLFGRLSGEILAKVNEARVAVEAPVVLDRIACAQVYGGPGTAQVTGELRRVRISAEFALTDACEIARWRRNAALLGAPGAGHAAP